MVFQRYTEVYKVILKTPRGYTDVHNIAKNCVSSRQ